MPIVSPSDVFRIYVERLLAEHVRNGGSKESFAQAVGTTRQNINHWLGQAHALTAARLGDLAAYRQIPTSALLRELAMLAFELESQLAPASSPQPAAGPVKVVEIPGGVARAGVKRFAGRSEPAGAAPPTPSPADRQRRSRQTDSDDETPVPPGPNTPPHR